MKMRELTNNRKVYAWCVAAGILAVALHLWIGKPGFDMVCLIVFLCGAGIFGRHTAAKLEKKLDKQQVKRHQLQDFV